MKPFLVEAGAPIDASGLVVYRFVCRKCPLHGAWTKWLSDAERGGDEHLRCDHGEGRAVA